MDINAHINAIHDHAFQQELALIRAIAFVMHSRSGLDHRADTLAAMCKDLPSLRDSVARMIEDADLPDLANAFAERVARHD